ncbi:uncharacterized protein LOC128162930 [Crassostrea angulata]|uniref:uncharacterized protein LOC128162930 n=1 Tax=Magallana angulata TaxID=2784310 RepID=UPI0022B0A0CE|nr:uncharacterized protein LOC128162930 [Crassostrea angulata]
MDKTDITEEIMEKPQEIMRWFPPTNLKKLDVCVRLQEDFGNPHQPATDDSQYQEHYSYTILRYGNDSEAQRALRIGTIHTFFHSHKITVAGAENMSLEELEMKYQLAKLFMYRRLVQERFMAMEREEGKSTCIITEITDDQDTPWYYRLIPCCPGTQKPKVKKPKRKKKSTGGSRLFSRSRKFFCRR